MNLERARRCSGDHLTRPFSCCRLSRPFSCDRLARPFSCCRLLEKSEIRISKFETNPKSQKRGNRRMKGRLLAQYPGCRLARTPPLGPPPSVLGPLISDSPILLLPLVSPITSRRLARPFSCCHLSRTPPPRSRAPPLRRNSGTLVFRNLRKSAKSVDSLLAVPLIRAIWRRSR